MLNWFYRWRYHRRERRRARQIYEKDSYSGNGMDSTNLFYAHSVQRTDTGRVERRMRRQRWISYGIVLILTLALIWLIAESIRGIGVFSG